MSDRFGITFEMQRGKLSEILALLRFEHLSSYIKKSTNPKELRTFAGVAKHRAQRQDEQMIIDELDFIGLI